MAGVIREERRPGGMTETHPPGCDVPPRRALSAWDEFGKNTKRFAWGLQRATYGGGTFPELYDSGTCGSSGSTGARRAHSVSPDTRPLGGVYHHRRIVRLGRPCAALRNLVG